MTDKQNFEYKATFIYGCKLPTGKLIDYEFVKLDFEKDIDVPSKLLDSNLTRADLCILINDLHIERIGKNKQLKAKEQKLEKIKEYVECEEWGILDHIYKGILQIIEGKENDR